MRSRRRTTDKEGKNEPGGPGSVDVWTETGAVAVGTWSERKRGRRARVATVLAERKKKGIFGKRIKIKNKKVLKAV